MSTPSADQSPARPVVADAQRVVIKVGSSLVTNDGKGLDADAIAEWGRQIAQLRQAGKQVAMVSSGAVAEGMKRLNWARRPREMHELQAAAAVGQMGLAQVYETHFREFGLPTALVLLTHEDLSDRKRYLNARRRCSRCCELGVVPIINENDTVVTDEIKFGDNDTLGSLVANLIDADALIILTDQSGLFTADPRKDPGAAADRSVMAGDAALEAHGRRRRQRDRQGRHDHQGAGGQARRAQRRAHRDGLGTRRPMCWCAWRPAKHIGTSSSHRHPGWPRASNGWPITCSWRGSVTLDAGAAKALSRRRQEPAADRRGRGERRVRARRGRGCRDATGREIARGLINYAAEKPADHAQGLPREIESILGFVEEPELIHRDNLVLR
jgi:glutamate 5-kinase